MSKLDLLQAGFSAIFGEDGIPSSCIDDLIQATYTMMKPSPLPSSLRAVEVWPSSCMIDLFVYGLQSLYIVRVPKTCTISELKAAIERKCGVDRSLVVVTYCGRILDTDEETLSSHGICHGSNLFLALRGYGGGPIDPSGLDPQYDFDFRTVEDDGKTYTRGGYQYNRPYGWNRMAVKVLKKYNGDDWLGPDGTRTEEAPNEWPVSYHGTKGFDIANKIIKEGFKPGTGAMYGIAVYSSPSLEMVEKDYAKEFRHEGKSYKIAFQNRVNPDRVTIVRSSENGSGADYWLSQEGDIRPYGVLIKEVN